MKEAYVKGLANHNGPESCGGACKGETELANLLSFSLRFIVNRTFWPMDHRNTLSCTVNLLILSPSILDCKADEQEDNSKLSGIEQPRSILIFDYL